MTGEVILKVVGRDMHVSTKLTDVSKSDRAWLMHCLAESLEMSDEELTTWLDVELLFRQTGVEDSTKVLEEDLQ